jgi:cold shock CspA family protein
MQETAMESPARIEFQGMEPNEKLREEISRYVAGLEDRFGRITACQVVIRAPSQHHRTGGLYEANVRLALPDGKEVNVGRTPKADERHGDVHFAVHDAFRRARRRLQDQTRRLRGDVKAHESPPTGRVSKLDTDFGFLETPDGRDIYFHRNSVLNGGFAELRPGTRVTFAEEMGEKGPQASTVRPLGKHGLRP